MSFWKNTCGFQCCYAFRKDESVDIKIEPNERKAIKLIQANFEIQDNVEEVSEKNKMMKTMRESIQKVNTISGTQFPYLLHSQIRGDEKDAGKVSPHLLISRTLKPKILLISEKLSQLTSAIEEKWAKPQIPKV